MPVADGGKGSAAPARVIDGAAGVDYQNKPGNRAKTPREVSTAQRAGRSATTGEGVQLREPTTVGGVLVNITKRRF